jgi:hypothetical protein
VVLTPPPGLLDPDAAVVATARGDEAEDSAEDAG